jgi:hypothetical protein
MTIELTDEQRQALRDEEGSPVYVIDPVTKRAYVLVARELYEHLWSPREGGPGYTCHSSSHSADSSTQEKKPLRQALRDLPLPPNVAAEAKQYCERLGLWGAKNRRQMEEQMKLQHYYGGRWIAYLRTDGGPIVVAAAESLNDPAFEQQMSFLTSKERRTVIIDSPTPLFDEQSEILTAFSDEV